MSEHEYEQRLALADRIARSELDRLRARLCGFLEAMGLPESQERAGKSMLKAHTYDTQRVLLEALRADMEHVRTLDEGYMRHTER